MNYWAYYTFNNLNLTLVANDKGLWFVGINNSNLAKAIMYAKKYRLDLEFEYNPKHVESFLRPFYDYFENKISDFSNIDIALYGSLFDIKVWTELQNIKIGQHITYSELALRLNMPNAVRAVASAVARNPLLLVFPCHRIISKTSKTMNFRDGADIKEYLLNFEQ